MNTRSPRTSRREHSLPQLASLSFRNQYCPAGHRRRTCSGPTRSTALRNAGKIVVIGAITPTAHSTFGLRLRRFSRGTAQRARCSPRPAAHQDNTHLSPIQTESLSEGRCPSEFTQRIPVPIGMWRPFTNTGAPLRLSGPAVIRIADQTATVLICYEQLIPWPTLTAFLDRPTIMIAIANQFWVAGTAIPEVQRNTVRAWARLFHVPVVLASNTIPDIAACPQSPSIPNRPYHGRYWPLVDRNTRKHPSKPATRSPVDPAGSGMCYFPHCPPIGASASRSGVLNGRFP